MTSTYEHIVKRINTAQDAPSFLDVLFGKHKTAAVQGASIVLFGAGGLGTELCSTLQAHGVHPVCFCDNNEARKGSIYNGLPVISFQDLQIHHQDSLIIIASHKYLGAMTDQLLNNGFNSDLVLCQESNPPTPIVFMYAMIGTQCLIAGYKKECGDRTVLDVYLENRQYIQDAYNLLADEHSKGLFVSKLALMASNGNFELFKNFIQNYSQPVLEFGFGNYEGTPEDYYYFNNDVLTLSPDEVYIDVGAYDGDTVQTFVEACNNNQVEYSIIHAFEPDPNCYHALLKNTAGYNNVFCHQSGVWSESQVLRFSTSDNGIHDQAGEISHGGNIEINVISLDDYLQGEKVTFIKMDPGGNVIPEALRGAASTIGKYKPKLALGAYHAVKSMFEIPLLIHQICPEYKLYLRHNTYHLCDTDLYATL